jgi:uncharacterized protein (TIGR02147 family)
MTEQVFEARHLLANEFAKRKQRNVQYSLRAFARDLDIPPGRLSEIFSQKRALTLGIAEKISLRLVLSPTEKKKLLEPFKQKSGGDNPDSEDYKLVEDDVFYLLSEWHHFAILNLIETRNFKNDPKWIAKRLAISALDVTLSLDRLERLGLIKISGGKVAATEKNLKTSDQKVNHALRKAHRDSLEQAIQAIDEVPIELRDISSMVIPVNMKRLNGAKKLIRDFRRKLMRFLEQGEKSEVYNLNIQLVPVTKVGVKND